MTTICLTVGFCALTQLGALNDSGSDGNPSRSAAQVGTGQALGEQFAALELRFKAREKAFEDELHAANKLEANARKQKITDENELFNRDWHAMAENVRRLIRAHPADPAVFEGIILLPGLMRSFLDDDLLKIVRDQFMDDPRMGRLCAALPYRQETWAGEILEGVAAKHPDRKVRGQATYALGMWSRYRAQQWSDGRERTKPEPEPGLADARRAFIRVTTDYPDVTSVDGTVRLADKARAELTRIANLPNLRIGKVAPEIVGEDLDGKPLKLSDHRGKVVVVCFWATWCGPCMAMVPHERELFKRMQGRPFALIGVNSDDANDREKARKITREKQMAWPSWWDGGHLGTIQTAYDVNHWPTVYVMDAKGVIRYFDVRGKDLDRAVDTLLAEMDAGSQRDAAR